MRVWVALVAVCFATSATAQGVETWYLTDDPGAVAGTELLSLTAPEDTAQTHAFSPLLGGTVGTVGPTSYQWTSDAPTTVDLRIDTDTSVDVYLGAGVDVTGTVAATLSTVAPDGTAALLATGSNGGADPHVLEHQETIIIATAGLVIPQDHLLLLEISVTDAAVVVQIEYNDAANPSAATFTTSVLDSDGDGFGDSAERDAGTDPENADSFPGNPDNDSDGLVDAWEQQWFGDLNMTGSDDPDGDGLDNEAEETLGTDPTKADTDDDGVLDGNEVADGTDPRDDSDPAPADESSDEEAGFIDDVPEIATGAILLTVALEVIGLALLGRFPA